MPGIVILLLDNLKFARVGVATLVAGRDDLQVVRHQSSPRLAWDFERINCGTLRPFGRYFVSATVGLRMLINISAFSGSRTSSRYFGPSAYWSVNVRKVSPWSTRNSICR